MYKLQWLSGCATGRLCGGGDALRLGLFVFSSDRMGGAERVTKMVAREAARSGRFDRIVCLILCGERSGTLDDLEADNGVLLRYLNAKGHCEGLVKMAGFILFRSFNFGFGSALHVNALLAVMRQFRLTSFARLVTRESTTVSERKFDRWGALIKLLPRLYGSQDLVVCQTRQMHDALRAATRGRLNGILKVIPNPIDLGWIRDSSAEPLPDQFREIPANRMLVVWCGRLVEVKAPVLAIDVLAHLHDLGVCDAHLVILGEGPLRVAVEDRISHHGLTSHVTLLGHYVSPASIMTRCRLGLLTSVTEGFPNVVLEMLASGVPAVVATPCTESLAQMPGVHMCPEAIADRLADLCKVLLECDPTDPGVSSMLRVRNPAAYLHNLLEDQAIPSGES